METRVKWNALFNKGAHPRPSLFEESNVYYLNISKTIGETKETKTAKEVQAKTIKHHRETKQTKQTTTFGPMSPRVDMGPKGLFVLFVLVFSTRCFLIVLALTSLVVVFLLVFSMVLMCSNFCIVCLSVCLETIDITWWWYKGFTFIRNCPW